MAPVTSIPYPSTLDYKNQGVPVPGTERPGQTPHYRNGVWGYISVDTPGALKTLYEIFENGYAHNPNARLLGHRPKLSDSPLKFGPYVWQTYKEVDVRRRRLGSALHHLFQKGDLKAHDLPTVGIWAQNRPEWQIVELALHAYDKVGVSLYDTLGKDSVEYIINHAQLSIVFTTPDHIPALLKSAPKCPTMKAIVSLDALNPQARTAFNAWGESFGIKIYELSELEALGQANLIDPIIPTPETIASICYTSGTTSNPKGVVLTHGNLALSAYSNLFGLEYPPSSCLFSYLPLAHIYERVMELATIATGGCVGYFTGDPLRLLEDVQELKPQFFPSVPRVLNRIYQSAMAAGQLPGIKGALFRAAVKAKMDNFKATGATTHTFWDAVVFRKVRAVLGGNLMLVSTGSAPISAEVMDFLKIALGCEVVEGYGMTENCGTCTHTVKDDRSASGSIGPPQPVNELKLVDVPSMNYTSKDKPNARGELCVRGANCFSVYYKDEKNTSETVHDGWIHTGDVAEVDAHGRFRIVDRVKNIMKLAQGEYVALEKVENLYSACPLVSQIYVHGDSLQSYLTAVVVPEPSTFAPLVASTTGDPSITPENTAALTKALRDPRVVAETLRVLTREAKKNKLTGFETVKRLHLSLSPFSVEDNTLTPTFKLRRKDAYAKFKTELDALYALGEPASSGSKL
ncbi:long-chain-fatty-acid-CoA ligase [Coniophora puteana RWD-64-598 SS2]|uniref:Long-chain-fatty-acid-CoA ligase n=1 Tax=Coniophora puteana (strain RWD-64-598) TaxID=741705 RepID=A0A5M3N3E9_CONPW|nr:long-chain-fatty-acid-CoA ligase [Coniophora puteana RWD-64-598 SS2]EIW85421.1 long-chain-fatty-acid-CoA ligase [Coniophora puteana RWD-64-598 SS2]